MKHRREKLLQRQQNAIQKNVKNEKQQQKTENSFKNSIKFTLYRYHLYFTTIYTIY